jgi:hypothetical protein
MEATPLSRKQQRFAGMLQLAIERKWFKPRAFATIRRRIDREKEIAEDELQMNLSAIVSSVDRDARLHADMVHLFGNIRRFRNLLAHPDSLTLLLPGMTYTQIEFARDAIAQLFVNDPSANEL